MWPAVFMSTRVHAFEGIPVYAQPYRREGPLQESLTAGCPQDMVARHLKGRGMGSTRDAPLSLVYEPRGARMGTNDV